ncbi:MAG TPA: ABC transporter ATP-binding protein [Acidobacteriaceae bacterium]|nr:ABC transporter ATP-binding protein [Acidobacteriaceae bacterium]
MPTEANSPRRTITVMGLLRPHRKALWLGLLAIAGESVADVLQPWPLKVVLDDVIVHKGEHGWLTRTLHRTVGMNPMHILVAACVAVLVIALLDAVCTYGEKWVTTTVGQWVTHDLRRALYARVQRLSLAYHDQSKTGDLISRVTDDIDAIQTFIVSGLLSIVVDIATIVGMIGVMFYLSWRLTLIAMTVVPVLFTIVYVYTRKVKKYSRAVRKQEGKMISVVQEVLGSIRVVKAFARENYEIQRLEGESLETVEAALKARRLKARLVPLVSIVTGVGTALVLYFGGMHALTNVVVDAGGGTIVVFLAYIKNMYKPMQDISKIMDSYSKADVGYERIKEVIEVEDELRDAPDARNAPKLRGDIDMENVNFCYNNDRPILSDINMHVKAGSTIAIVGPTGSGKTTLVNLIPRFYDVTSGVVKVDGIDVRTLKQRSLREQISLVMQDTLLFSGTIWDNIAYGRPEAGYAEIVRAAQAANASEFIDKLPHKYDTVVGERGLTLSGGQRQRIAIARAIVRNSPILILDEPSSGLDAASEQLVFEALDRLMENKTSIVIAHRLATIRKASCIYVVKDGRIVEQGTHDELIARDGVYRQLHDIQFQETPESADAAVAVRS